MAKKYSVVSNHGTERGIPKGDVIDTVKALLDLPNTRFVSIYLVEGGD